MELKSSFRTRPEALSLALAAAGDLGPDLALVCLGTAALRAGSGLMFFSW
jgi:hypothetical protein